MADIEVVTRRPGAETDGLFEILDEQISTQLFVRPEPVKVGTLRSWQSQARFDLRYPLTQGLKGQRHRSYQVWFHAVRLLRPPVFGPVVEMGHPVAVPGFSAAQSPALQGPGDSEPTTEE